MGRPPRGQEMTTQTEDTLPAARHLPVSVESLRTNYERNMISWVSLGMSLISFGFTIYKFFEIELDPDRPAPLIGPREFALAMIAVGLTALITSALQNRRQMEALRAEHGREAVPASTAGIVGTPRIPARALRAPARGAARLSVSSPSLLGIGLMSRSALPAVVALLVLVGAAPANAQPKTDIVILSNGDRITGEIKKLERGRLEFSTDDAGTLYLEWDKLIAVVTTREMEVMIEDGTRYLGHLPRAADRVVTVVEAGDVAVSLPILSVTVITPIGTSLWRKVDGSFDVGFSYTQSSGIAQLNVNSDTILRMPGFRARLLASLTAIDHADGTEDDRASRRRVVPARPMAPLVRRGGRPIRDQRKPRSAAPFGARRMGGPARHQQQPRSTDARRRPGRERRTERGRSGDAECRDVVCVRLVVFHLRPAKDESRPHRAVLPEPQ